MNFIDLKTNDKIYIITNINDIDKPVHSISNVYDDFSSLELLQTISTEEEQKITPAIYIGIIKNVIYPGKRKTGPYSYMKMCDGRPCGVGHSYGEEEDKNLIQFDVLNTVEDRIEKINIYMPEKNNHMDTIANKAYYINLNDARKFLFDTYNRKIDELKKKKEEITKDISYYITLRNSLEDGKE
jgi:hypothetical protein